jgi:hypothetical protein
MIGERLIIRQMRKRCEELVEIHAGRIRHDLDERIKTNVSTFSRDLLARIDATVAGSENAINGGLCLRDRGQEDVALRGAELARSATSLAGLDGRLTDVLRRSQEEVAA